jgi:hypothetical protein
MPDIHGGTAIAGQDLGAVGKAAGTVEKGGHVIKLAAKFARQESEEARQARIARRRPRPERLEGVRRMLGLAETTEQPAEPAETGKALACLECGRRFARPMHLGRHVRAAHGAADPRSLAGPNP